MYEQIVSIDRMETAVSLFGSFDENIKLIEKEFSVSILNRGSDLKIGGDVENVSAAVRAIGGLLTLINKGEPLNSQNVSYIISLVKDGNDDKISEFAGDCICITTKGKAVKPKTLGQKKYIESIKNNTIVFGIGPAGTGKTGPAAQGAAVLASLDFGCPVTVQNKNTGSRKASRVLTFMQAGTPTA